MSYRLWGRGLLIALVITLLIILVWGLVYITPFCAGSLLLLVILFSSVWGFLTFVQAIRDFGGKS
jgi:hypothetical protein